jgi:hypothetical protein
MKKLDSKKILSAVSIAIIFFFLGYWFGGPVAERILNIFG